MQSQLCSQLISQSRFPVLNPFEKQAMLRHIRDMEDLDICLRESGKARTLLDFITTTQLKALTDYKEIVVALHHIKFNVLNLNLEKLLYSLRSVSDKHRLLQRYLAGQKYLTWDIGYKCKEKSRFSYHFPTLLKACPLHIPNENLWVENAIDLWFRDIDFFTLLQGQYVRVDSNSGVAQWLGTPRGTFTYAVQTIGDDNEHIRIRIDTQATPVSFNCFYIPGINLLHRFEDPVDSRADPSVILKCTQAILDRFIATNGTTGAIQLFHVPSLKNQYIHNMQVGIGECQQICVKKAQGLVWELEETSVAEGIYRIESICLLTNTVFLEDLYQIIHFYQTLVLYLEGYLMKKDKCLESLETLTQQIKEKSMFCGTNLQETLRIDEVEILGLLKLFQRSGERSTGP